MDESENKSNHGYERSKAILQIVAEKALLGITPVSYRVHEADKWQTVRWWQNPTLWAVEFSDGSVIQTKPQPKDKTAPGKAPEARLRNESEVLSAALERELGDLYKTDSTTKSAVDDKI